MITDLVGLYFVFAFFVVVALVLIIAVVLRVKYGNNIETGTGIEHTRGGTSYKNINCYFGKDGRNISKKDIKYYRDIPNDGDIFRSFWYIFNYDLGKRDEDFLGAVLLKWIKDGNISLKLDKYNNLKYIVFVDNPKNCNEIEEKLYHYMFEASFGNFKSGFNVDFKLDISEFKMWYINNRGKIGEWFSSILDYEVDNLVKEGKIVIEKVKNEGSYDLKYIVNPSLKEEAIKLAGLKKFFEDFTVIKEREGIEVKLFDYYLIYATMFGLTDSIYNDFKDFYPNFSLQFFVDEDVNFINYLFSE